MRWQLSRTVKTRVLPGIALGLLLGCALVVLTASVPSFEEVRAAAGKHGHSIQRTVEFTNMIPDLFHIAIETFARALHHLVLFGVFNTFLDQLLRECLFIRRGNSRSC